MAKPKRPQRPATGGAGRAATSGATNTRPAARAGTTATANGYSNPPTATTPTPARGAKSANGTSPAPRGGLLGRNGTSANGRMNGGGKTGGGASATTGARPRSPAARSIASRAAAPGNQRRRQRQSAWQQVIGGQRGVWIALVSVAVIVTLFVILAQHNGGVSDRQPVPTTLYNQVTRVSPSVLAQVGTGGVNVPFKATPSGTKLLTSGGKPEFVYMGGEYCPHCAAERWAMVVALSRFGTFSNLRLIQSTANDTPANVPTFTFYKSTYTSPYLTFTSVELYDRATNNLETPTAEQSQLLSTYDTAPYSTQANAIPFLDLGNQFIQVGEGYPSTLIATDTWQSIGNDLGNPSTPEAQNILGNANYLTAAICTLTNNQPASVCAAAPIPSIQQKLPKGQ